MTDGVRRRSTSAPEPPPAGVVVGTLASVDDASVTPGGVVHPGSGSWSLEWLVGAADRWHRASTARPGAASQRLVDGVPVVETSVRVPGGQLVQRVWAVADGGAEVAVLEVENRSKEAVSLALVVGGAGRVRYDGELDLDVDGTRVATARRPSRVAVGGDVAAVIEVVESGAAAGAAACDTAASGAALVWPLAHTASLRVAVVLDGVWRGTPAALPDATSVVRGWRGHVDAGARSALPDPGLQLAITTARATALIRAARPHPPALAARLGVALEGWGHHEAALAPIEHLLDLQRLVGSFDRGEPAATGAAIAAWSAHVVATGDADLAGRLAEPTAKAAHRIGKLRWKSAPPPWVAAAQLDAARLLDLAGQPDAADLCRSRLAGAGVGTERGRSRLAGAGGRPVRSGTGGAPVGAAGDAAVTPAELTARAPRAGGGDLGADVELLLAARRFLADDGDGATLRLLRSWPDEWLGADLEAHRLPTRLGLLSYAVRWHGARPALLWELHGHGRLTVPGLDPSWSTDDPAGEALLAPVEPAGGLPGVVRPLAGPGTPVDDALDEGTGFA
jgi:hypothetical protein